MRARPESIIRHGNLAVHIQFLEIYLRFKASEQDRLTYVFCVNEWWHTWEYKAKLLTWLTIFLGASKVAYQIIHHSWWSALPIYTILSVISMIITNADWPRYLLRKTYLSKGGNITMSWTWKRSYSSLRPQFTYLIFIYIHSHLFITLRVYLEPTTNAALVLHRSWVLIPYRPKFFSGLLLTTAQIVFVFVKIAFMFTSLSAVHIYDFHMFTVI